MFKFPHRFWHIFLCVLLATLTLNNCFAEGIDLTSMDIDELLALKNALTLELQSRPEASPFEVNPGTYIVGEDIKAGKYYIAAKGLSEGTGQIHIYETKDQYQNRPAGKYGDFIENFYINAEDYAIIVTLVDGNLIYLQSAPVMFSVNEFEGGKYYTYTPPEGTYVPAGIYTVGVEIPAGTYQFFAASLNSRNVHLYEKSLDDKDYETIRIRAAEDDYETAILSDGNILEVRTDIVMRKQPALTFE